MKRYILNELKIIEKECMEKDITASEWVKKYAEKYRWKYEKIATREERLPWHD